MPHTKCGAATGGHSLALNQFEKVPVRSNSLGVVSDRAEPNLIFGFGPVQLLHSKLDLAEKSVVAHFSIILKFSGKVGFACLKL